MNFPEIYDREWEFFGFEWSKFLRSFMDKMKWGPNESILDHGCGHGRACLEFLVPRIENCSGSKIYGVDRSPSMIQYAQEKFSHPKVTHVKSDLLSPDFPYNDMKFDKIFSLLVLHFLPDAEQKTTLQKMYDLMTPGGQLAIIDCLDSPNFWARNDIKVRPEREKKIPEAIVVLLTHLRMGPRSLTLMYRENEVVESSRVFSSTQAVSEFILAHDPLPHERANKGDQCVKLLADIHKHLKEKQAADHPEKPEAEEEYLAEYKLIYVLAENPLE